MDEDKKKILIIDDDTEFDSLLSEKISLAGMTPVTAVTGQEALDYIKANKVDFIILDFIMPGMDGAEFYRTLTHDMRKIIPAIVLTNLSSTSIGDLEVFTKAGTNLDELVDKIKKKLYNI